MWLKFQLLSNKVKISSFVVPYMSRIPMCEIPTTNSISDFGNFTQKPDDIPQIEL